MSCDICPLCGETTHLLRSQCSGVNFRYQIAFRGSQCSDKMQQPGSNPCSNIVQGVKRLPTPMESGAHVTTELAVRFADAPGFVDSSWLVLSPGVSVVTGRNSVGKARLSSRNTVYSRGWRPGRAHGEWPLVESTSSDMAWYYLAMIGGLAPARVRGTNNGGH